MPTERGQRVSGAERNLTLMEAEALLSPTTILNLTDGHPRMPFTQTQRSIVTELPRMFDEAHNRPFSEIEVATHASFLSSLGQHQAPVGSGRILSTYSSTIALDIVARTVKDRTDEIGLIHPTFDNIADLFRARGLRLHPMS